MCCTNPTYRYRFPISGAFQRYPLGWPKFGGDWQIKGSLGDPGDPRGRRRLRCRR